MSGRSAKVSSLSDKIQGLKFMQRAAASSSSGKSEEKAGANGKGKQAEGLDNNGEDGDSLMNREESEQWSLRKPSISTAAKRTQGRNSKIVAEPGWNHWLGSLLDDREDNSGQARMVFGSWAEKEKKRKKREIDAESEKAENGMESEGSEGKTAEDQSDEDADLEKATVKHKEFIKPGTLTAAKREVRSSTASSTGKQRSAKNVKRRKS
jgi:hypothetical protein